VSPTSSLPNTGAGGPDVAGVAIVCLLGGAFALFVARRRVV
jgi:LPXTG-motif cell wall-anchored protein